MKSRHIWTAALMALTVTTAVVRLRLMSMPLERDEGEFAYMGQLMLQGAPPYQFAFNIKLPGTAAMYAIFMVLFGQTPAGIRLGFLFVNLGSLALLFPLARRLMDHASACVCCAAFLLLSISPMLLGLQGHASLLVVFFALAGLLLLLRSMEKPSRLGLLFSGLLFGWAFVCKQPGFLFCLLALVLLAQNAWNAGPAQWRTSSLNVAVLALGLAAPFALTCLIIWHAGTFARFWFWTVTCARAHADLVPWRYVAHRLRVASPAGFERWLFLMGLAGWLWGLCRKSPHQFLLTSLLICSAGACVAGRYLIQHYFVFLLPAICPLLGLFISGLSAQLSQSRTPWARFIPGALFAFVCAGVLVQNARFWFAMPPDVACSVLYFADGFVECREIGNYIHDHSKAQDRVAVIGSEPEIYFYAKRRAASGYLYMYDLVHPLPYCSAMQQEFMHDVETVAPEFLVEVNLPASWDTLPGANPALFDWIRKFPATGYDLIGVAEIYPDHSVYRWGREASGEKPGTYNAIFTFKKKPAAAGH